MSGTSVDAGAPNRKADTDGDANIRPQRDEDFDPRLWLRRRGRADGAGGHADQERAIARALDAGVNCFDTAVKYSRAED